jgi:hypothetical protein
LSVESCSIINEETTMEELRYPTQEDVMAALRARTSEVSEGPHGTEAARAGECADLEVVCIHRF